MILRCVSKCLKVTGPQQVGEGYLECSACVRACVLHQILKEYTAFVDFPIKSN